MRSLFVIAFILSIQCVQAQPDSLYFKPKIKKNVPVWTQINRAALEVNEVSFVNWNAGGSNSISALAGINSVLKYQFKHFIWDNAASARYGINRQQEQELRKTDDLLELRSNLGYHKNELTNWYYSARFSFKTQFTNGYNYPNTDNPISKFMAPGYLFMGGGVEYGKNIEKFSTYFSPLTLKTTFVLDEDLANTGSFGVKPAKYDDAGNLIIKGEHVRKELGVFLTSAYEASLFENISIKNLVSFYTDYINDFGNVDVDWEVVFDLKVNSFIRATLGSHLRYDNDIKILIEQVNPDTAEVDFVEEGASIQWKQMLGIGVIVDF